MRTLILFLVIFFFFIVDGECYLNEKPSFMTDCSLNDAHFESCYAANLQTLFSQWKDGVPGLKSVGKLDPLEIKRLKISQPDSGTISLRVADLKNLFVSGTSSTVIKKASLNRKGHETEIEAFLPKLRFDSDYKLDGRILSLNLKGQGKSQSEAEKIHVLIKILMKTHNKDSNTFADIQAVRVHFKDIGGFNIQLSNLFDGQKDLEDSANALLNESWRELYASLRPAIEQTIEAVLLDRFKKIFEYVPANYFITDISTAQELY